MSRGEKSSTSGSELLTLFDYLIMENNQRGIFFGKRLPISQRIIRFARKYHGYYFAWSKSSMGSHRHSTD
jgi:hypothetical protein